MINETITAIATPIAVGGISVIRISGAEAVSIADKVFNAASGKPVAEMQGYTCSYGTVFDGGQPLDDVVLTFFRAPKSYTGEDVVEISCHGGVFITRKILRVLLENGARLAEAGEFTKRAFLNGKLSLTQAEAVMDLISSTGKNELKYAVALRDGAIFRRIRAITDDLLEILGDLAAWADYPEDDIPEVEPSVLLERINGIIFRLDATGQTYDYGRIIREGINTVIIGKPNVGKSTLMNCLTGFNRSIVTDIAGTTRDIVEESVKLGELTLRLADTAGIRNTADIIESMGVDIARKRAEEADLILAVFDSSEPLSEDDMEMIRLANGKNAIAILNKSDKQLIGINDFQQYFKNIVEISAKNYYGIEKLSACLEEMFIKDEISAEQGIIANERQKLCLDNAEDSLKHAAEALIMGENLDAVNVLLDEALGFLLQLTGEKVSEAVVDEVFSRFCVGK